jgi:hypothetical protein
VLTQKTHAASLLGFEIGMFFGNLKNCPLNGENYENFAINVEKRLP